MLTELRAEGYKSFRESTAAPIRPLTILLGKNSSGKTALARLPLALLSAIARRPQVAQPLPLKARGLVLGSSGTDLVHGRLAHGSFSLGMTTTTSGLQDAPLVLDVRLQLAQTLRQGGHAFVASFSASPFISPVVWQPEPGDSGTRYSDPRVVRFDGLLPEFEDQALRSLVTGLRSRLEANYAEMMHLASVRTPLEAVYEKRDVEAADDVTGAEAAHLLARDPDLAEAVAAWYSEHLGVTLDVEAEASSFGIWVSSGTTRANLARAGQGYQQVLPVVTYLAGMAAELLPLALLVVEEPELHLHPAVHGGVADLLVATVTAPGRPRQVLVETHSENLVLRVRRHVAAGNLDADDVNILWLDGGAEGVHLHQILIGEDGSVSGWPAGVFSEDLDEVRAIAREARR